MPQIALSLALLAAIGCAASPSPRLQAARERVAAEELVLMEFDHGGFEQLLDEATQAGMEVMRPTLEEELGRELSRTEDEKLARFFRATLSDLYPRESWVEALARIYPQYLSLGEIEAILEFYRTPEGARLLKVQPTIEAQAEVAAQRLIASRQEEFEKRFQSMISSVFEDLSAISSAGATSSALSIVEAIRACRAIQAAGEIPIGCEFEYLEGRPSMFVALPSLETANDYWLPMSDEVAGPFCEAANAENRQALVFVSVVGAEAARIYSCESDEWSDWFSIADLEF